MNPIEVQGIAALSPTGSLTTNPVTGQPEAFLPFLAPLLGSALGTTFLTGTGAGALGGLIGSAGLSSGLAGAIGSGLATTAVTGDLKKGLISGLGECIPYKRYGEDREKITHYLKKNKNINHLSKIPYLSLQNAIDNSLLDIHLQDKKKEYKILLNNKKIYETLITVPILTIDKFKKTIKKYKNLKKIKIKLNQQNVFKYLDIIKNINPKISLVIDAN
ncbi:MAG: hypothetical protein VW907_08690, partial [Opitutae bacterium]